MNWFQVVLGIFCLGLFGTALRHGCFSQIGYLLAVIALFVAANTAIESFQYVEWVLAALLIANILAQETVCRLSTGPDGKLLSFEAFQEATSKGTAGSMWLWISTLTQVCLVLLSLSALLIGFIYAIRIG